MTRDLKIQLGAAVAMIALFGGSTFLTASLAASAGRHRLVYTDVAEEGAPPEVPLGIAMGAFRGVFVNFLWIRANELKQEGKYFEAVDLARAITKLQPRFPRVWAFHAWNLAYNISVATQTPEERWGWVQAGIRLLREEGIPKNPNDLLLHKELAWIFLHKVQGIMDDANQYYKRQFAREWHIVLGPPPTRDAQRRTTAGAIDAYAEWLGRIAAAPDTVEQAARLNPAVRTLAQRLRSETGLQPDRRLLEAVEPRRHAILIQRDFQGQFSLSTDADPLLRLMLDPEFADAWGVLIAHTRKRVLIDEYRMEPDRMVRYTRRYGPLDWRHPASHALYWSARGVEEGQLRVTEDNRQDYDFVNTDRLTIQAVQELYRSGAIQFSLGEESLFLALPSPDFIPIYGTILEELATRDVIYDLRTGAPINMQNRAYNFYSAGYENFLKDAIRFLYRRGQLAEAEDYYQKLRVFEGQNINDPDRALKMSLPLAEFVKREVEEDERFTVPNVARDEVVGALQGAFVGGLLAGNTELFNSQLAYARWFHGYYNSKQVFSTAVNVGDTARLEVMDRDFTTFAARVLAALVQYAGVADGARMYQRAPAELQRKAYVFLERTDFRKRIDAEAAAVAQRSSDASPRDFDVWFPPPEGVDTARREIEAQQRQQRQQRPRIELK